MENNKPQALTLAKNDKTLLNFDNSQAASLAADYIAKFEGFISKPYRDVVGVETIGFGETDRDFINKHRQGVTLELAKNQLVNRLLKNYCPAVDVIFNYKEQEHDNNRRAALYSFAYNLGPRALHQVINVNNANAKGSNFGKLDQDGSIMQFILKHDYERAARAMLAFVFANKQIYFGLARRRAVEANLFLNKNLFIIDYQHKTIKINDNPQTLKNYYV